ncbi:MAG: hypothetical protein GY926_05800 [bacterium]|nr:hypothetical protein [bacterium]
MVKQGDDSEPLRPGWYPVGDSRHQRYYAGRQKGWTDNYTLEIDAREPRCPPRPPPTITVGVVMIAVAIVVAVAIGMLGYMSWPTGPTTTADRVTYVHPLIAPGPSACTR